MKLRSLPKIKSPVKKSTTKKSETPLNTHHFASLLKKFKLKKLKSPNTPTDPNLLEDDDKNIEQQLEMKKTNIENQRYLVKIYETNFSSVFDKIKQDYEESSKTQLGELKLFDSSKPNTRNKPKINFTVSKRRDDRSGFEKFNATNYVTQSCMTEFFHKYSKFNTLYRKHPLEKLTPTWAFIKASKEEKIIPNPLGLLNRYGEEDDLNLKYNKVGDNYISAISDSLRYSRHLRNLELNGNRITSKGTFKLFSSLNCNKDLAYNLRKIDLSENKIGNSDIKELLAFIQDSKCNIEDLNFFGNLMGSENCIKICESLANYIEYRLVSLNLGQNNMRDICVNSICQLIAKCSYLRVLILSLNWFGNNTAQKIMKSLSSHYELRILDISWNCIGDDLTKLPTYESLVNKEIKHPEKTFDNFQLNEVLSNKNYVFRSNPLVLPQIENNKKNDKKKDNNEPPVKKELKKIPEKPSQPSPFAQALGEYFGNVQLSLIHLDISHNNLNYTDCQLIAEKAKDNHQILGMHVDGNAMEIDCLGFLNPIEKEDRDNKFYCESQIYYNMNKEYKLRKTNVDSIRKIRGKNHCWICEGFREMEFEFIPEEPIDDPNNHLVKIHLDFDGYRPFDMICTGTKFLINRMCPPGEIHYFFTVDTVPVKTEGPQGKNVFHTIHNPSDYIKYEFENDYIEELNNIREKLLYNKEKGDENEKNVKKENLSSTSKTLDLTSIEAKKIDITVDTISVMNIKFNKNVINDEYRKNISFSEPRPAKIIDKFVKPKTPWSYPVSIWAYYGYDYDGVSEDYLDKCFNFDFNRCQFEKDFKDEASYLELKEFLRERYRDIIDCYKYYSSYSGCQIWQITQNSLTEFINKCPGMCDKTYDINNVYLQQKVVCGNLVDKEDKKKKNKNLSDNIVRHQFMNILVKAAKDKYITILKVTKDPLEATKMAFEKHFDEAIKGFEYHKWLKERYYNEQVDNFLKTFLPLLDGLYLSWAKQKGPTKKDVWMVLDEFNTLIQTIVDINEYPIRDNPYIFNQAIQLQINEIYTDKHVNMFLPEFLEALCRAIDKASPMPPGENKEEWPMARRQAQTLLQKLENILPSLIKLIRHPDLKTLREKFPIPSKDLVTGLYVPNFENPFYQGYIIKPENRKKNVMKKAETGPTNENTENNVNVNNDNVVVDNNENKEIEKVEGENVEINNEEEKKEDNNEENNEKGNEEGNEENNEEEKKDENENGEKKEKDEAQEEEKKDVNEETAVSNNLETINGNEQKTINDSSS